MLSVQEAEKIIFEHILTPDTEGVDLMSSLNRILAEDLIADRDFPPFDRVTMDGIAIKFQDFEGGHRHFKIIGIQAAGKPQLSISSMTQPTESLPLAMEVMTGAILPDGLDTVIRYEDLKIQDGIAHILINTVSFQQNLHKKGIDRLKGNIIVPKGKKITAAEIGTAATIGKSTIQVLKQPKIAIISTGDELVEINETPLPYQIRRSNVFSIAAILKKELEIDSDLFHFNDDETVITEGLNRILSNYHIVVLSGAVSEGKFDFVPKALDNLGVTKLFHKVAQRPGKPFWFGKTTQQTVIFALPGNPVSTFLCTYRYLIPFLKKIFNQDLGNETAILSENLVFKPNLTYFLPVKVNYTEGGYQAQPLEGHGSGDLANLNDADGFLELSNDKTEFMKGESFKLIKYR